MWVFLETITLFIFQVHVKFSLHYYYILTGWSSLKVSLNFYLILTGQPAELVIYIIFIILLLILRKLMTYGPGRFE